MDQNQSLRQRGWSIHSDSQSHQAQQQQRPRADSQMTCDTDPMSDAEKLHLLNNAFDVEEEEGAVILAAADDANNRDASAACDDDDDDDDDSGDEETGGAEPPKKRRKTGIAEGEEEAMIAVDDAGEGESSGGSNDEEKKDDDDEAKTATKRPRVRLTTKQQEQLDVAKNKLSKWAARLFDPNRRRGLVEAPKVIPLNDEFLTAFGKREKEYDEASGRVVDVDKTSLDIIDVSDDENEDAINSQAKTNFSEMTNCKVKISNMSYKTTSATIANACGAIGPVLDVNLILDDNGQSSGRAYVVFEDHESAVVCAETMNEKQMEGRTLYVSVASASGRKSFDPSKKKKDNRYWERDISVKCMHCGGIGHLAKNCPNEEKLKPCGLCAGLGHDMWSCPQKSVCFNCGVPGHVSRECRQRRGLPERVVCTICHRSGHHRYECRERPWDDLRDVVCMQSGQKGQLMCTEMRWFFGLKGASCFNCGGNDHTGTECRRPNVDVCYKCPDVALQEIDRAGTISITDQVSNKRSSRESRSRRPNGNDRPRSMPPPRNRGDGNGMPPQHWREPPPQRTHHRF